MPGIIYTTTDAAGVKVEWERLQWPPPAKGTHESDLGRNRPHVAFNTSIRWETNSAGHRKHGWMEFYRAGNWSRRA